MNTMKRDDMIKEQENIVEVVGKAIINIVGVCGRYAFLQHEINKVTPKTKGNENGELDSKEKSTEGVERVETVAAGPQGV